MIEGLEFIDYVKIFCYLFLPILILGIFVFWSILISNRMGGKNKFIVFIVRIILVGACLAGFFYYFYYLMTVIFVGG